MRSLDQGETWEDRKEGSQFDSHDLTMTKQAEGRIYEAAGGGYAQSKDNGETWETINDGREPYKYLVNLAVDSGNPDVVLSSAGKSGCVSWRPSCAYSVMVRGECNSTCYYMSERVREADGTADCQLIANETNCTVFCAVNNL